MKRWIAAVSTSTLLMQSVPAAFAFEDVNGNTGYRAAIEALKEKGVIEGYADGTFQPLSGINRAEFLKILLESRGEVNSAGKNCFPDVQDQWFASYVCTAKKEGIVSGYPDGSFKPENEISFVEASKMLTLAYGQQPQTSAGEWYEGYGRALEASKAIPPTISGLATPLKRGEMAEMMWRLSEGKTDEPSKGLLNVKYPDVQVNLSSDEPQQAKSCSDLKAFTESAQNDFSPMPYVRAVMMEDAMANPQAQSKTSSPSGNAGASSDFSKTNVQVQGVDEADRVKTDGAYLYVVSRRDGKVRIVDVRDPANLSVVSTITFSDFIPQDLYIDDGRLVVTGQVNMETPHYPIMKDSAVDSARMMIYPPIWFLQKTGVKIYDIADRTKPKEVRSLAFEGYAVSSRLVDGRMLLVMSSGPRWHPAMNAKTSSAQALLPVYDDSAFNVKEKPVVDCDDVTILPRVPRPQYLVVASIPLQKEGDVSRSVILGNGEQVFASLKNLYVTSTDWSYVWKANASYGSENTLIYRFSYDASGADFKAQGVVPGRLLNQFSMDESGEMFRIATTRGPQWSPIGSAMQKSSNNLYVLSSSDLETVGSVENIAPGESIYSVRFMGDRAYMVTFKQVDPLFVIDLSSPRNPKILGELKIPGYSNYLHPVDENHILGFGKEVDESIDKDKVHSDDAVYYTAVQGMKLALFDVSDVRNPKEIHKEVIGSRGTESPLLYDHKALLFDVERGLLAFPITVYEPRKTPKGYEWAPDTLAVFQGAYIYDFNVRSGFTLKGKITHIAAQAFEKAGDYWYDEAGLSIDRLLRVGDVLFAVSEAKVTSNALSDLSEKDGAVLATERDNSMAVPMPLAR